MIVLSDFFYYNHMTIEQLLERSFLISEETKKKVKQAVQNADETVLQNLQEILEEADQKQYGFLKTAVQNNPHLIDELNTIYAKGMTEKRKTEEAMAMQSENAILKGLEELLQ